MASSTSQSKLTLWSRLLARMVLATAFLVYSAAKFAGAQFVTSGETLDKPVADLSGIALTWVYFGYSPLYSNFIAVGQLLAAALLVFDRTARLGAVALFPIAVNIVVINFGFHIGTDTQIVSSVLLMLNLYLLAWDLPALKRCFWDDTASGSTRMNWIEPWVAGLLKGCAFAMVVAGLTWVFLFIAQNQNGEGTAPIVGEWLVESTTVDGQPAMDPEYGAGWRWICFEPDRRMSVRTNRWTFRGRYTAVTTKADVNVRYDPESLPPVYPWQPLSERISDTDRRRLIGAQLADFKWPIELSGSYRKDGNNLVINLQHGAEMIEWKLTPLTRPKF